MTVRLAGNGPSPVAVTLADAYGPDRQIEPGEKAEIVFDCRHTGGWYDIALTTPSDPGFSHQLAGRLEQSGRLTSDPQLRRASRAS